MSDEQDIEQDVPDPPEGQKSPVQPRKRGRKPQGPPEPWPDADGAVFAVVRSRKQGGLGRPPTEGQR